MWFGKDDDIEEQEKIDDLLANVNNEHEPIARALRWLVRHRRADRIHFSGRLIRIEFALYVGVGIAVAFLGAQFA